MSSIVQVFIFDALAQCPGTFWRSPCHVVKKRPAAIGQETKVGKGQEALEEGSLPISVAELVRKTSKADSAPGGTF